MTINLIENNGFNITTDISLFLYSLCLIIIKTYSGLLLGLMKKKNQNLGFHFLVNTHSKCGIQLIK